MKHPIALSILSVFPLPIAAATVTFNDIKSSFDPENTGVYQECGVTVESTYGDLAYHDSEGMVHICDYGTDFAPTITITTGALFNASDIVFSEISSPLYEYEMTNTSDSNGSTYVNGTIPGEKYAVVRGYRGGYKIAEARFTPNFSSRLMLDDRFENIDTLEISAESDVNMVAADLFKRFPDYDIVWLGCSEAPCSHFNVDSVTLSGTGVRCSTFLGSRRDEFLKKLEKFKPRKSGIYPLPKASSPASFYK